MHSTSPTRYLWRKPSSSDYCNPLGHKHCSKRKLSNENLRVLTAANLFVIKIAQTKVFEYWLLRPSRNPFFSGATWLCITMFRFLTWEALYIAQKPTVKKRCIRHLIYNQIKHFNFKFGNSFAILHCAACVHRRKWRRDRDWKSVNERHAKPIWRTKSRLINPETPASHLSKKKLQRSYEYVRRDSSFVEKPRQSEMLGLKISLYHVISRT